MPHFNIAETLLLLLSLLALLVSANQHGKTKEKTENFWTTVISVALQISLMYWAGLFR